jgi:hypothetical protein
VKENVNATVIRYDETKAPIFVEHLNFASRHAILKVFLCCQLRTDMRRKQGRTRPATTPGSPLSAFLVGGCSAPAPARKTNPEGWLAASGTISFAFDLGPANGGEPPA